jgi:hypothetical protein
MAKEVRVSERVSKKNSVESVINAIEEAKTAESNKGTTTNGIRFKLSKNVIFLI